MTDAPALPALSAAPAHVTVTVPTGPHDVESVATVATPESASEVAQPAAGTPPMTHEAPLLTPVTVPYVHPHPTPRRSAGDSDTYPS